MSVDRGFTATEAPELRQGDHVCVHLSFVQDDGLIKRIGTVIMPEELVSEFMTHFASPNVT